MRRYADLFAGGRLYAVMTLAAILLVRIADPLPLAALRHAQFDLYQVAQPRIETGYPVRIVDIDEKSLAAIGQWPWPRSAVAEIVDKLAANGATAVGFDVLFSEPDRLSPSRIAAASRITDTRLRTLLEGLPDNDAVLATALRNARAVLGQGGITGQPTTSAKHSGEVRTSIATLGGDPRPFALTFSRLLENVPVLESAAAGRGLVTVQPDHDGIIRRVPLVLTVADQLVPALSVELVRVATAGTTILVKTDTAGIRSLVIANREVATDRDGQLWLHFARHDPARYISAADVLADRVPKELLAGRIVLVGTSAVGLLDLRATPVDPAMPGVEIHAQAIESILGGGMLARPNYAIGAEIVLAIAAGIAITLAVPMLGALPTLLVGAVVAVALSAVSWFAFTVGGVLLDVTYPLVSCGAVFLLMTFGNYVREERQRAWIRSAFRQYLSPDLVEQLSRHPDRLVLGGETREMTILFSDVRGFTAIAERFKDNPTGLTALINRLLTPISKAVIAHGGTIDKYMGDAVMAFWNAPLDDPEHAHNACQAALDILDRLDILNDELRAEAERAGVTPTILEIGIGVATGINVVGNMGSDLRFDYSALGDSVNVASRLEGLASRYGLRLLVSSETARRCGDRFTTIAIDTVVLKGRAEPEEIHAVVGGADLVRDPQFSMAQRDFARLRAALEAGRFDDARSAAARVEAGRLALLRPVVAHYLSRISEADHATKFPE